MEVSFGVFGIENDIFGSISEKNWIVTLALPMFFELASENQKASLLQIRSDSIS